MPRRDPPAHFDPEPYRNELVSIIHAIEALPDEGEPITIQQGLTVAERPFSLTSNQRPPGLASASNSGRILWMSPRKMRCQHILLVLLSILKKASTKLHLYHSYC